MINFHLLYKSAQAERMLKEAGPAPGLAQRAVGPVPGLAQRAVGPAPGLAQRAVGPGKPPAAVQAPRESTRDFLARHNAGLSVAGPPPGWIPPSMRNIRPVPVPSSPQGGPMAPTRIGPVPQYRTPVSR
ncbi:MAG: hypothetical protein IJV70_01415 [Clostridia bacterium]|nr:hypothetical protein [Clostridia bacterium]